MDWLDVSLKFSSELLVVGLVLLVGFLNIVFFKFGTGKSYSDNSHAFKLLSYHTGLNAKYYGKETSVSTVFLSGQGLIAQARADDFEGLSGQQYGSDENLAENSMITENSLVKPNPDSIKDLVAKQIKIYETKPGDSLESIAQANGISMQTLADANRLAKTAVIQPGWQLVILPVNGVLYTAGSNDTLPDVAKKFSGDLDTIISYNGLGGAEDIEGGQVIIIPGGHMPLPPAPAKPKTTAPADKSKVGGNGAVETVPSEPNYDGDAHIFPKGYCTWYVAQKVHIPWGGNAKNWIQNSKAYGAVVDMDPAPGTIVVTTDSPKYGHVAYVEKVTATSIIVSEMNYEKFGKIDWREIPLTSKSIRGYIHP